MKNLIVFILHFIVVFLSSCNSDFIEFKFEVSPTESIDKDVPVYVEINLPDSYNNISTKNIKVFLDSEYLLHGQIPGQIMKLNNGKFYLCWILPETDVEKTIQWTARVSKDSSYSPNGFEWENQIDESLKLFWEGNLLFSYEYGLDSNFIEGKTLTAKNRPFYSIYDLSGNIITNPIIENGRYPHHRGIMIGWKRIKFMNEILSFWGMEDLTVQKHVEFKENVAGPVFAKSEALILWNDNTGNTLIEEERKAIIYKQSKPGILMLDMTTTLTAVTESVILDGDPDHGGIQYRAHNDVADIAYGSKEATYYFPENVDSFDRSSSPNYNFDWVAMQYGLNFKNYTVLQMDNPHNEVITNWSAYRDYGRFGVFFKKKIGLNDSLVLRYRFCILEEDISDLKMFSSKFNSYSKPIKILNISS